MINPVNNISFKSVYVTNQSIVSKSQEETILDIKNKLAEKSLKKDFVITPLNRGFVRLTRVRNVKEVKNNTDEKLKYKNDLYIGTYDENHPFNIEDYDFADKQNKKYKASLMALTTILIGAMIARGFALNRMVINNENKAVSTMMKDSIQNITKDSLKIFK